MQYENFAEKFLKIEYQQCQQLDTIHIEKPVTYVYNPLLYARNTHEQYVRKYCQGPKEVVFLGMNPGPFGMAQNGVPFGEVNYVRTWLKIDGEVGKPIKEHPKRPVQGLQCKRSEDSGKNVTPPQLNIKMRNFVTEKCNEALRRVVELLEPSIIVGVGKFAEEMAIKALGNVFDVKICGIMHPSPCNPKANQGWKNIAQKQLDELGVTKYLL